ncbi:MAG: hypothetical protein EB141_13350 [Verrucomicrobia bacterium]|nr:hypothetical protein [Verrucomicrobiota bacterium]NBU11420.1 hypothetical protein [Pseudomonadota bacterium]NDA68760.1 hypothetical protein [Verrucomicrobiota bacterium]NDB76605.1 hypothetical protein [Verrucomicrobiota bacterium]NDD39905.1 hypothetical protein [Verrucomicrobiota bacterium]
MVRLGKAFAVNAKSLTHGTDYAGQRLNGWLVQEKFDGLRCLWDGRALWSREGNQFNAPAWFVKQLPAGLVLDGELYAGPGGLTAISNTLARHKRGDDEAWTGVEFVAFDAPLSSGNYLARHAVIPDSSGVFLKATVDAFKSMSRLRAVLREVHDRGGEGLMLRHPTAHYERGRTSKLLKFKCPTLAA